jgi:hypothetical protein
LGKRWHTARDHQTGDEANNTLRNCGQTLNGSQMEQSNYSFVIHGHSQWMREIQ